MTFYLNICFVLTWQTFRFQDFIPYMTEIKKKQKESDRKKREGPKNSYYKKFPPKNG